MTRQRKTMDGNTAAAHVAYAFSEVAAIYPITPSSPMAESMDEWASQGRKNIFGEPVRIVEMESEGGVAGAVHGSVMSGALTSTFSASQGLLLMIPNMYKIAAEQLPAVFHIAARTISTHALCIFGDHSDVMSCRQTGFALLASNNVQQCMDLAAVAHLTAIKGKVPVLHFFDGFRTSHENQKVEAWDYNDLSELADWDAIRQYRKKSLHPMHPYSMGSAEQPETFFQHREACNKVYEETADLVNAYMEKINKKIGTEYKPFNYYGAPDAREIIIAMGSVCDAAEELIDYLNARGKKVGIVQVHLYRPFSTKYLLRIIPETVQKIATLDRTKEPGSIGEPLFLDVSAALQDTELRGCFISRGRYGLGSKDTQPGDLLAVYENLWSEAPKKEFTISITDDVTGLSLSTAENPDVVPEGTVSCKFWGLGADGTVGANKNSVKIIGDHTEKYVQAYFQYDSKKSGGVTVSHLRFGEHPIKSSYYVKKADFVACHNAAYLNQYKMVQDVKPGGIFLLNCAWTDEELAHYLPVEVKQYIAKNHIRLYTCDAVSIAKKIGLGTRRTNSVLQAAFFKLADIIPIEEAVNYMKSMIEQSYRKKGDEIVKMNCAAVDAGVEHVHKVEVPEVWKTESDKSETLKLEGRDSDHTKYLNGIMVPANHLAGDELPVSTFVETADGRIPPGTSAFEKRGIAAEIPLWDKANCMQCNWCAYVCPHGVIRPFMLTRKEAELLNTNCLTMKGAKEYLFAIGISAMDCTGCGSCAQICPARKKALSMVPAKEGFLNREQKVFDDLLNKVEQKDIPFKADTVKGSQFIQPLLEFSGACPGCGETPYAKLITQLFGNRMFIANATGCSSIWGCSAPSTPYTVNREGRGPAWANSLFEDNAEFGFGMVVAVQARRKELKARVETLEPVLGMTAKAWLASVDDAESAEITGKNLLQECEKIAESNEDAQYVIDHQDMLIKPSMWILGGDGWAYDIGYGGLDHVLASGENVNIMVFDTEVYSNTGGQSSKATPAGAVAKFAAAGKSVKKKDLAQIAMTYGYVYVAQIAMGANPNQTLQAIREAEAYDGPSLIIAYAPCINHGIKSGMDKVMLEMRHAVRSGYWNLFRYNPTFEEEGKNPLSIDSAKPIEGFRDFLLGEVRYNSLKLRDPQRADVLFEKAEKDAIRRYEELWSRKERFQLQKERE